MKVSWFKRKGLFFLPISVYGWILFFVAVIYAVYIFFEIDNHSHSVSDTIRNFILNLIIIGVAYSLIALFTSRSRHS